MRKFVDDVTLQNAYMQALDIIEDAGVRFESEVVREFFKKRGARIEGDKVFFPRHLVEEALESTPKQEYSIPSKKRVVAATPFSNAPFILDDDTGALRRCNIEDAIKMYQINETSALYECANPGCADPLGNDAPDPDWHSKICRCSDKNIALRQVTLEQKTKIIHNFLKK